MMTATATPYFTTIRPRPVRCVSRKSTARKNLGPSKSHTLVSRSKDPGHRYYSPDIARWLSRDPIGERGGTCLYGFLRNRPVSLVDALGLAPTDTIQGYCQAAKGLWDGKRRIRAPGTGTARDWWNFYTDHMDCPVEFTCDPCCKEKQVGYTDPKSTAKKCRVKFCTNRIAEQAPNFSRDQILEFFVHELTHCFQVCEGCKTHDCNSCVCNEIQAYHRQNPVWGDKTLEKGVRQSCYNEDGSGWCKEAIDINEAIMKLQGNGKWEDCRNRGCRALSP